MFQILADLSNRSHMLWQYLLQLFNTKKVKINEEKWLLANKGPVEYSYCLLVTDKKRWFLSESRREWFQSAMSLCINDWVGPRRNAGLHPRAKPASVTLYPGQNGEKQKVHFVTLAPGILLWS